jgi:Hint domain
VETLAIGDLVLTAHNGPREVVWIGKGKVLATHGRRTAAMPVIVCKDALADNVPNRDLHITKAHSLYIDEVLIPVAFLVNHRTILWDDRAREVEIYHVELESHDVLIANGAPAESFRDDGNRWLFQNARSGWHLPPQEPYAPVLTGGPIVDAVWRRLLDRAGSRDLPPLTDDPDLHLLVGDVRVDAVEKRGSVYVFRLPHSPGRVVIASREVVPSECGIAHDPRSLGVALRRVTVRQGARFMLLDADDERLTVGFHEYEADCHLRWTDGHAELPAEAFARFDKGAQVTLYLGGATQYPDDPASVARAA